MKFGIPQNIFAAIFAFSLPDKYQAAISGMSSAVIAKELSDGKLDLALIPSCDLFTHKELFISKKAAISFDGELSNSYLYFNGGGAIDSFFMRGDVTSNDIILSKLIFQEKLKKEITVTLDTGELDLENKNYIIAGGENFEDDLYKSGLSFSDQVADMLDAPYVNYLVAAKTKEAIEDFNKSLSALDKKIEDNIGKYLDSSGFDAAVVSMIKSKLNQLYFELTENEINGFEEMIRMPFYQGVLKDIIEVNFV